VSRHVCIVTETYPPEINGVAVTLAHLVAGMRTRGHIVSIVRPRQPAADIPDATPDRDTTLVAGARLPGYPGVRFGFPAPRLLRAAWRLRHPDAVYVATEGPLGWSAVRAGRALGIPVYTGFHTNFHRYVEHYGAGWLRRPVFAFLRRFHNAAAGTLVSTPALRDELTDAGFRHLTVLGRGVDGHRFDPARRSRALRATWGASESDLVILSVGRLASEKNIRLAVEAYRVMQNMNRGLRFVVVGDGPLRAALERDHRDLVFRGFRTGDDLAAHYASADVFLFPSETETFGNVILEAMASGLVVVAYDCGAAQLYLDNGVTGVVVRPGDARGFVDAAAHLVQAPESLPPIRRRARAAMEALDWARIVERFERLLTGTTHREENDRAEQRALAPSGARSLRRGGARNAEARERAPDAACADAASHPAATAVPVGQSVPLRRRPVLPG
jgi:glycosyltransferase involved in cell wall biosynthesis